MERAQENATGRDWIDKLLSQPVLTWVLLGFLISYLFFYLWPIFLRAEGMIFPLYIPVIRPGGADLLDRVNSSKSLLLEHRATFMGGDFHPPLTALLFAPFLLISHREGYDLISLVTIACYAVSTLWFARRASRTKRVTPLLLLLAVTGFLSYGFQFQLERGQCDVITMTLALVAVALFYWHPRLRPVSYLLLTLAIQVKLYPAILALALVAHWRDWKREGLRILGILAFSVACLFALGPEAFLQFLTSIRAQVLQINPTWRGNHSAASFAWQLLPSHAGLLEVAILVMVVAILGCAIWRVRAQRTPGLDPYLLLVCFIAALVIPSISNDYTLPILVAPLALFFDAVVPPCRGRIRAGLADGLLFLMGLAYSCTLFSYTNKTTFPFLGQGISPLIENNFLPLLLVLLAATALVGLGFLPLPERETGDAPESPQHPPQAAVARAGVDPIRIPNG